MEKLNCTPDHIRVRHHLLQLLMRKTKLDWYNDFSSMINILIHAKLLTRMLPVSIHSIPCAKQFSIFATCPWQRHPT